MEGFPGIKNQDKGPVDERFQMLAAVDFPSQGGRRAIGIRLSRRCAGPPPVFARRIILAGRWFPIFRQTSRLASSMFLSVVAKSNCSRKTSFQTYVATAPNWMTNIIANYSGNPYHIWWRWQNWRRKTASLKASCCTRANPTTATNNGRTRSKAFTTTCSRT